MKKLSFALLGAVCLTSPFLFAGTGPAVETPTSKDVPVEEHHAFPFEADFEYSYVGESEVSRGRLPNLRDVRDMDEDYLFTRFLYTPMTKVGILRLGAEYQRFGFGAPDLFEVPSGLQELSAVIGLDTKFSDAILVRLEMTPGLYSGSRLDGGDFHAPVILGGTYVYSSDLQFVLGASFDYEREQPVLPGGGVRWRMTSQLVLDAVLPTPRLNYELSRNFTLFVGGDLKGGTFRVSDEFGNQRGDSKLNHAVVTYTEVRAGGGFEWKLTPEIKMTIEGGYLPYRNVDFYRADIRYHHEEGAPYGSLAFRAAF